MVFLVCLYFLLLCDIVAMSWEYIVCHPWGPGMPLQEFTHIRTRIADPELRIGVRKKGRVSLNASSLEALGHPTHVVLLFDPETLELGVRAARSVESHSYMLRKDTGNSAKSASVAALWSHYNLNTEKYVGSYIARQDGSMLVISLRAKHGD
jgi:hypothetical protein